MTGLIKPTTNPHIFEKVFRGKGSIEQGERLFRSNEYQSNVTQYCSLQIKCMHARAHDESCTNDTACGSQSEWQKKHWLFKVDSHSFSSPAFSAFAEATSASFFAALADFCEAGLIGSLSDLSEFDS
jgi:hypothetical protein